jgi:hypothetical protein
MGKIFVITDLALLQITFTPQNLQRQPSRANIASCSVLDGILVWSRSDTGRHFGRFIWR